MLADNSPLELIAVDELPITVKPSIVVPDVTAALIAEAIIGKESELEAVTDPWTTRDPDTTLIRATSAYVFPQASAYFFFRFIKLVLVTAAILISNFV